jgi:hypothetical protein
MIHLATQRLIDPKEESDKAFLEAGPKNKGIIRVSFNQDKVKSAQGSNTGSSSLVIDFEPVK